MKIIIEDNITKIKELLNRYKKEVNKKSYTDSENWENEILTLLKPLRYKNIGKILNTLIKTCYLDDKLYSPNRITYDKKELYNKSEFNSFMDFFTRRLNRETSDKIKSDIKDSNLIMPNESYIESLGELTDTKKIIRLKKSSTAVQKDFESFGVDVKNYNYINMKLMLTYYHRIHSPCDGIIKNITPIDRKENFFGDNTLWIIEIETKSKGVVYLLLVGESDIQNFNFYIEVGDKLKMFDDIGYFNWGSQTLILYDKRKFNIEDIQIKEKNTYFVGGSIFKK